VWWCNAHAGVVVLISSSPADVRRGFGCGGASVSSSGSAPSSPASRSVRTASRVMHCDATGDGPSAAGNVSASAAAQARAVPNLGASMSLFRRWGRRTRWRPRESSRTLRPGPPEPRRSCSSEFPTSEAVDDGLKDMPVEGCDNASARARRHRAGDDGLNDVPVDGRDNAWARARCHRAGDDGLNDVPVEGGRCAR
jgi:hypothetical protein